MAAFFKRGDSVKAAADQSADRKPALDERERRLIYAFATAALVLAAIIFLTLGGNRTELSACKGVLLQNQRNLCFLGLADSTGNASVCGYVDVQAQRDSCFAGIAEAEKNGSVCGEISRADAQYSQCLLNVSANTGDERYCEMLNGTYRSSCLLDLAKAGEFGSLGMCNITGNESATKECDYMYYYNSALKSGSAGYCAKLPGTVNSTLISLMATNSVTSTAGGIMQDLACSSTFNVSPQSCCYYNLAALTHNSTLCAQTSGTLNEYCLGAANMQVNSTSNSVNTTDVCSLLQGGHGSSSPFPGNLSSLSGSLCTSAMLINEALSTKNISKCLRINTASFEYSCVADYAKNYSNPSDCFTYIANSSAQQDCYMTVTGNTNRTA
jgi:hypothetical protein